MSFHIVRIAFPSLSIGEASHSATILKDQICTTFDNVSVQLIRSHSEHMNLGSMLDVLADPEVVAALIGLLSAWYQKHRCDKVLVTIDQKKPVLIRSKDEFLQLLEEFEKTKSKSDPAK